MESNGGYIRITDAAGAARDGGERVSEFRVSGGTLNGAGAFTFPGAGVPSVAGTANQVLVNGGTAAVTSAVTLTLPQSIGTGSSPTFAALTLTGDLTVDTTTLKVDSTNNRVGVGTATLTTTASFVVNGASADYATTVGNFLITESSNTNRQLRIGYDGVNEAGWIQASRIGVGFKPLGLNPNGGSVGVGTVAPTEALDVFGRLALRDMAAPSGGLTDGVRLWSESVAGSSELKVRDEAGNVSTLSPHAKDAPAWMYDWTEDSKPPNIDRSANVYAGSVTFDNRTRAARLGAAARATSESLPASAAQRRLITLYEETFAEYNGRLGLKKGDAGFLEVESWDANQAALEVRREDERAMWRERKAEAGRQRAAAIEENKRRTKALAEWEKMPEDERKERPKDLVDVPEPFEVPEPLPYQRKPAPAWLKKGKG